MYQTTFTSDSNAICILVEPSISHEQRRTFVNAQRVTALQLQCRRGGGIPKQLQLSGSVDLSHDSLNLINYLLGVFMASYL